MRQRKNAAGLTVIGTANVIAARDGRTLMLGDARELQLAAIETADDSRNPCNRSSAAARSTQTAARREQPLWSAGHFHLCGRGPATIAAGHAGPGQTRGYPRGSATGPAPTPC